MCRIPVEVQVASEFRYCAPIVGKDGLVIVISQSGETSDTKAALEEAKARGARVLSIVNVVGSAIAKASDDVIYTWAGPEIAVAATKACSTQLTVIYLIAAYMADKLGKISKEEYADILRDVDGARITAWWTRAADITPANGKKGVGVRKILDYYHLD